MTDFERELGRHSAEIDGLKTDMAEVKTDVKAVLATLSEARGGWKTLMLVAGAAGAAGAALTKLAAWLQWLPRP